MLASIIKNNLDQIKTLCQKHKIQELYVFGSGAYDQLKETSDIDFLYVMKEIPLEEYADNLFEFEEELQKLVGRRVDLVPKKYLRNRFFIREVDQTKQIIYQAA